MDHTKLSKILIGKIKADYSGDISLVHLYGSVFYGDANARSDLDIFFVPKTERGFNLSCSFIIDDVGVDFWGISWDRLGRIARHDERISAILTEGEVLYYDSDEDLARFEHLKSIAADTSDKSAWHSRARHALDAAYKNAFLVQAAESMPEARRYVVPMIYDLTFAIAQLNQKIIKRSRHHLRQEILSMPLVPDNFPTLYDALFAGESTDAIKSAAVRLMQNTETLVQNTIHSSRPILPAKDAFHGWYEEMIQSYNKIHHACQTGDIYTPLFASAELTHEFAEALSHTDITANLPDLAAAYDSRDLGKIARAAVAHQQSLESFLAANGVTPLRFSTLDQLELYLATK